MTSLSNSEEFFEALQIDLARIPAQLEELFAQVGTAFRASQELRKSSRPGGRLTKKYFEEIYPLTLVMRHLHTNRNDVLCQPNFDDSKSFDATLSFGSPTQATRKLVEFAQAKDGRDESLRMQVLNEQGHVSLTGPLEVSGTKRTGHRITIRNETRTRSIALEQCLRRIMDRLHRKAGPKYKGVDYLVVVFDDMLGFRKPEELDQLRSFLEASGSLSNLCFQTLILLGSQNETFLTFQLSD